MTLGWRKAPVLPDIDNCMYVRRKEDTFIIWDQLLLNKGTSMTSLDKSGKEIIVLHVLANPFLLYCFARQFGSIIEVIWRGFLWNYLRRWIMCLRYSKKNAGFFPVDLKMKNKSWKKREKSKRTFKKLNLYMTHKEA